MTADNQSFCPLPTRPAGAGAALAPAAAPVRPDIAEIFGRGSTWQAFLEGCGAKALDMKRVLDSIRIPAGMLLDIKSRGPLRILAFGEAWCPDVIHHFPIVAALEGLLGDVHARFFNSDSQGDLLASLSEDGKKTIPLILFYDLEYREIARIRGRKPKAKEWMKGQIAGREIKDIPQQEKDDITTRFIDHFLQEFSSETWEELNTSLRK